MSPLPQPRGSGPAAVAPPARPAAMVTINAKAFPDSACLLRIWPWYVLECGGKARGLAPGKARSAPAPFLAQELEVLTKGKHDLPVGRGSLNTDVLAGGNSCRRTADQWRFRRGSEWLGCIRFGSSRQCLGPASRASTAAAGTGPGPLAKPDRVAECRRPNRLPHTPKSSHGRTGQCAGDPDIA